MNLFLNIFLLSAISGFQIITANYILVLPKPGRSFEQDQDRQSQDNIVEHEDLRQASQLVENYKIQTNAQPRYHSTISDNLNSDNQMKIDPNIDHYLGYKQGLNKKNLEQGGKVGNRGGCRFLEDGQPITDHQHDTFGFGYKSGSENLFQDMRFTEIPTESYLQMKHKDRSFGYEEQVPKDQYNLRMVHEDRSLSNVPQFPEILDQNNQEDRVKNVNRLNDDIKTELNNNTDSSIGVVASLFQSLNISENMKAAKVYLEDKNPFKGLHDNKFTERRFGADENNTENKNESSIEDFSKFEALKLGNENIALERKEYQNARKYICPDCVNDNMKSPTEMPSFEHPVNRQDVVDDDRIYHCSIMACEAAPETPVCACNYITGKVATFKNDCDRQKHNCRFETHFKTILPEICPWEFESRRSEKNLFDYSDEKYYNIF